jgi:hypothetical protein
MIALPSPIAAYIDAANAHDATRLASCFVLNATLRDEGTTQRGRVEIEAWARETTGRYKATIKPQEVAERDDACTLRARVHGNFPGSPVILAFDFVLQAGAIQSLEIHA